MKNAESNYYKTQLEKILPIDKYGVQVQFSSTAGKTNWMTINETALKAITTFFNHDSSLGRCGGEKMAGIMDKLTLPSQRDLQEYTNRIRAIESAPLAERKENAAEWGKDLQDPTLIAERVYWLLDGNYGAAEYYKALQILASPRMNRVAALSVMIAALEWNTPQREAIAQWKKLTINQQNDLQRAIETVMKEDRKSVV